MDLGQGHTNQFHDVDLGVPIRKRTVRACDQCRRRKTKCDGGRPCSTCGSIGLNCSYGSRIKQARGPTYVVHLEKKVEQLQLQMKEAARGQIQSPATTSAQSPESPLGALDRGSRSLGDTSSERPGTAISAGSSLIGLNETAIPHEPKYITTIPDPGVTRGLEPALPYGKSAGLEVLRRMRSLCGRYAGFSTPDDEQLVNKMLESLDVVLTLQSYSAQLGTIGLPPPDASAYWIDCAFREAFCLWPFVDRMYVDDVATRFFCNDGSLQETIKNRDDLALLQMVIALGQRNDPQAKDNVPPSVGLNKAQDIPGSQYFTAATRTVDACNCGRSLVALQVMLCFALYTKSINAMSQFHAHATAAAGAAIRMGLHESAENTSPSTQAIRARIWSTVRMLDTYSTTAIGLPSNIHTNIRINDAGDPYPVLSDHRVNVELIASNAHSKLTDIFRHLVGICYLSNHETLEQDGAYKIRTENIRVMEDSVRIWERKYSSGPELPLQNLSRPQLMLELAFEYYRIILYSPFAHHAGTTGVDNTTAAFDFACEGILAATRLVQVVEQLEAKRLLNPNHPFLVQSVVFAATILLLAELHDVDDLDDVGYGEFRNASETAHGLLGRLAAKHDGAAGCYESLSPLYSSPIRHNHLERRGSFDRALSEDHSYSDLATAATTMTELTSASLAEANMTYLPPLAPGLFAEEMIANQFQYEYDSARGEN